MRWTRSRFGLLWALRRNYGHFFASTGHTGWRGALPLTSMVCLLWWPLWEKPADEESPCVLAGKSGGENKLTSNLLNKQLRNHIIILPSLPSSVGSGVLWVSWVVVFGWTRFLSHSLGPVFLYFSAVITFGKINFAWCKQINLDSRPFWTTSQRAT